MYKAAVFLIYFKCETNKKMSAMIGQTLGETNFITEELSVLSLAKITFLTVFIPTAGLIFILDCSKWIAQIHQCVSAIKIYMKKLLDSDWLIASSA